MIESQRIKLLPLTAEQIELYLRDDFSFEDHFSLKRHSRAVDEIVKKKLSEEIIPKMQADPENYLFYTLWVSIDQTINTAVAGIVFKGPPNENGEVELGAGTFAGFMNRGYMTETTKLLCEWALKNDCANNGVGQGVKNIVANASPTNGASIRTLEKIGFVKISETEENTDWKYRP